MTQLLPLGLLLFFLNHHLAFHVMNNIILVSKFILFKITWIWMSTNWMKSHDVPLMWKHLCIVTCIETSKISTVEIFYLLQKLLGLIREWVRTKALLFLHFCYCLWWLVSVIGSTCLLLKMLCFHWYCFLLLSLIHAASSVPATFEFKAQLQILELVDNVSAHCC